MVLQSRMFGLFASKVLMLMPALSVIESQVSPVPTTWVCRQSWVLIPKQRVLVEINEHQCRQSQSGQPTSPALRLSHNGSIWSLFTDSS